MRGIDACHYVLVLASPFSGVLCNYGIVLGRVHWLNFGECRFKQGPVATK